MKRYVIASLAVAAFVMSLISCKKDETLSTCPVDYRVDTNNEYKLGDRWEFVGFENIKTGQIDAPLCGNVESWIYFADTLNTRSGSSAYQYSRRYEGVALINHFGGTYDQDEANNIMLSPTVKTTVRGTAQVEDFEARFHQILSNIDSYRIENNELILEPAYGDTRLRFVALTIPVAK